MREPNTAPTAAPHIVTDNMLELVLALLSLGALRTVEKLQGRAR
ncbi:MAG: hypothetical protein Tsb0016_22440 [Sphingomonadales bacterium]